MNNLILIGFKGAGKTTLGKKVAAWLHRPFLDTDDLFDELPPLLYQTMGADAFYAKEKELIQVLRHLAGCVISTGGGTPLQNGEFLRSLGTVIHLQTSRSIIEKRIGVHHPFLKEYHKRLGIYDKIAHHSISSEDGLWEVIHLDPFLELQHGESRTVPLSAL